MLCPGLPALNDGASFVACLRHALTNTNLTFFLNREWRISQMRKRKPILNSQFSIPNSQFPILNSQFSILNSQFSTLNSPFSIPNSQFSIPNSQFPILNSQFSILNSQFSTLNSPFSIPNSQFSIPNSQFSILNSQFEAPREKNRLRWLIYHFLFVFLQSHWCCFVTLLYLLIIDVRL